MSEQTFLLIKPHAIKRGLIGQIFVRLEERGLELVSVTLRHPSVQQAEAHYAPVSSSRFFGGLVAKLTEGPVVCIVVAGNSAVQIVNTMAGATTPKDALPGTIRGDLATTVDENIVDVADSYEEAQRLISIWA